MRVGIAGTGTMGEIHAAAWRDTDAELIGCTSAHSDQAETLAPRYQMRAFSDYAKLLNEVEIVDICTPTPLHKPMVLQAAKQRKHLICEKPAALTPHPHRPLILPSPKPTSHHLVHTALPS